MPVARRNGDPRVEVAPQDALEGNGLARCVLEDWASAADFAVVVGDLLGAAGSDQAREGLARDAGERKIDNIWVAEDVVKEVLNSRDRIRTAQLEKDHAKLHSN